MITTDILIIGSGGAGLSSAISIKEQNQNLDVLVLSKSDPTSAQTAQAQGGINAVLNSEDSIDDHIENTIQSAHKVANTQAIKFMCQNAQDTKMWLDRLAVPFSRDEKGNIAQRKLGAASFARACYSSDYTGLKILHTLYDRALQYGVKFLDSYMVLDLIVEDQTIYGVVALDIKTTQVIQILAKKVILASGGYGGIYHNHSTNSTDTTGDIIYKAYKNGVKLSNLEFIQFHPTSLAKNSILISESARGEGGYLIDENGNRFVDELQTRDIVAREIFKKRKDGHKIYLDLRHIPKEKIEQTMPQESKLIKIFTNKDLHKDIIEIKPSAHYSMGGIKADIDSSTNIKNLYAIGECANSGVHGANRLGGNSLLEIVVFGKNIANNIVVENKDLEQKEYKQLLENQNLIDQIFEYENKINFYEYKDLLGDIMYDLCGIYRDQESLQKALKQIVNIEKKIPQMGIGNKNKIYNTNLKEFLEFCDMVNLASLIVKSALQREESRGSHYRLDFPDENQEYEKETILEYKGNI